MGSTFNNSEEVRTIGIYLSESVDFFQEMFESISRDSDKILEVDRIKYKTEIRKIIGRLEEISNLLDNI